MTAAKKMKELLQRQGLELERMGGELGQPFDKALSVLKSCKGSIVIFGFGKSGAVGAKLASTLRAAGRRAFLLDPIAAFYGEAASISHEDVAIAISSSGESDEIIRVLPWLKKKKAKIIALTPSGRSSLARAADILLKTSLPLDATDNFASYSTCVSALALGDLLAMALLYEQDIESGRTSRSQAAGGEAIYTVEDLLATRPGNPVAAGDMIFRDALLEITSKGLGAISIVGADGALTGIVTDGDVRRLLQKSQGSLANLFLTSVKSVMTKSPKHVRRESTMFEALKIMEDNSITVLPVVGAKLEPVGMIHLHDLVQLGLLKMNPSVAVPKASPEQKKAAANTAGKKKKKTAARK
ncbi:MAG TPA: SIS domain-containing protein [bacterium]|nr:SIS domain-containing protein [bacterium]HPI75679.1 SIS domain-containing protein [bacterium]HPN93674.1 SIS domain-containing protein [bacterium]